MQNSREACLLRDFYSKHRPVIDALAEDDEMFRAVKEIAEAENANLENLKTGSQDKRFHKLSEGGRKCLS